MEALNKQPFLALPGEEHLYPVCYSWSKATRDLIAIMGQVPYSINEVLNLRPQDICTRSPEKRGVVFQTDNTLGSLKILIHPGYPLLLSSFLEIYLIRHLVK